MTIPKVAIDITKGRKNLALFYVTILRVKCLDDLMFEEAFDLEKLIGDGGSTALDRQLDWQRRAL